MNTTARILTKIGAYAAWISTAYFTAALAVLLFNINASEAVLEPFVNNWLVTIFKVLAAVPGGSEAGLYRFNFLDVSLLLLAGIVMAGLAVLLWTRASRVWTLLALAQPFAGIILFTITQSVGRSALMGSLLAVSIAMLREPAFPRRLAALGICAGVFLFAGDLGVSGGTSPLLSVLFAIGYLALIIWFYSISQRLNLEQPMIELQARVPHP